MGMKFEKKVRMKTACRKERGDQTGCLSHLNWSSHRGVFSPSFLDVAFNPVYPFTAVLIFFIKSNKD
jgi:hypothetical protein